MNLYNMNLLSTEYLVVIIIFLVFGTLIKSKRLFAYWNRERGKINYHQGADASSQKDQ